MALLAAAVVFIGATGKKVPVLSNVRVDIILLVILAMSICTQAGIGRIAATGQWSHPLAIRTFVGDVSAPLQSGERTALTSLFQMLWGAPQPGTFAEDLAEYKRLCTLGSTEFILAIPDYHAFFTYTMFCGRVPKA